MEQITGWKHTCTRCYHVWMSFKERPKQCAGCRNPYWDKPYKVRMKGNEIASEWEPLKEIGKEIFFPHVLNDKGEVDQEIALRRSRSLTQWLTRRKYRYFWNPRPSGWDVTRLG